MRNRKKILAVDGIDLTINKGELVAYIGPNGAGKSTTIKMLTGILNPTSGSVLVDGINPFKERKKNARHIGVVFGQRSQLWWHLPIADSFRVLKAMYDVPAGLYIKQINFLKELLGLDEFWAQPVRALSLGQRMRGEIAAALIHKPDILYLDEPTIGMDVLVKEKIRDFLAEINHIDGTTILLTTHDLEDVEKLCKRVVVINHGTIVYDGSMQELHNRCPADARAYVEFDGETPVLPDGLRGLAINENKIEFFINRAKGESALLGKVASLGVIKDIRITEAPIEDVVRELYEGGK